MFSSSPPERVTNSVWRGQCGPSCSPIGGQCQPSRDTSTVIGPLCHPLPPIFFLFLLLLPHLQSLFLPMLLIFLRTFSTPGQNTSGKFMSYLLINVIFLISYKKSLFCIAFCLQYYIFSLNTMVFDLHIRFQKYTFFIH